MNQKRFYQLLGIDPLQQDRLAQANTMLAEGAVEVRSKSPDRTIYRAMPGGRAAKALDSLAKMGLFSVSREGEKRRYEPTKLFVDFWRTYDHLRSAA